MFTQAYSLYTGEIMTAFSNRIFHQQRHSSPALKLEKRERKKKILLYWRQYCQILNGYPCVCESTISYTVPAAPNPIRPQAPCEYARSKK